MRDFSTIDGSGQLILRSLEKFYLEKKYDVYIEKLREYQKFFSSGIYHYNLGTAYFKNGQFALARYHLEKSLEEGAVHTGVYKNLAATVQKLDIQHVQESLYFKDQALGQTLRFPQDFLVTISLIFVMGVVVLMRLKKIGRKITVIFFIFSLCPPIMLHLFKTRYKRAVVLEQASAHEGPSRSFEVSSDLPKGVVIIIERQSGNWFYIKSPEHFSGWINQSQLGIL